MSKNLADSNIQRQNVLNNHFALQQIENELTLDGTIFQGVLYFTKQQIAGIFNVDERTIDRYVSNYNTELSNNGYIVLKGKNLLLFKHLIEVGDTNVVDLNIVKTVPQLGIFSFKSLLNLAMLLTESEQAKIIRSRILDIVIDVITQRSGGHTKYINQRDEDYLLSTYQEEDYRKNFTDALDDCIDTEKKWKYAKYTNLIYKAIFEENAREYRKILNLKQKEQVRDTFYAEILDLIAAFEAGYAESLRQKTSELKRKLSMIEADLLFAIFAKQATLKPLITKTKIIMSSRDYCFRDAHHEKLKNYIQAVPEKDYERFLGEKSKALAERIEESLAVYKRLKDR